MRKFYHKKNFIMLDIIVCPVCGNSQNIRLSTKICHCSKCNHQSFSMHDFVNHDLGNIEIDKKSLIKC